VELVRYLWVNGYKLAIATGSGRKVVDAMLEESELKLYFETTVSSSDVRRGKPDPESFDCAASKMGVPPEQCLVIEDSQYGVLAAERAGMRCLALPALGSEAKQAFERAEVSVLGGPARLVPAQVIEHFELCKPLAPEFERIQRFRTVAYEQFENENRPMPWRETNDPFLILASEFMLQQTQVARVVPKFKEFARRYPTPDILAAAPLSEFMAFWQGLGYNRRAKHLKDTARVLCEEYGGQVPDTVDALRSLPGVGEYTASAVAAFAFHQPVAVIETNIRRLFLHFFFAGAAKVPDREVGKIIERALDSENPRRWYYALMDYGSYLGKLFPNANRRSAHYTKQSRFEGSVRQVRGKILRVLAANGPMSRDGVEEAVGPIDQRFESALEGLMRDGILSDREGRLTLD
ncbi:MAG: HAD-IA family hydrolase, partial [Spirochaetota bacterium]